MVLSCVLLLICGLFLGIYSLKRSMLFPLAIKAVGVTICFSVLFITVSKLSHYQSSIAIDHLIFKQLSKTELNLFVLSRINNVGIAFLALSTILFAVLVNKHYKTAGVLSTLTIAVTVLNSPLHVKQRLFIFFNSLPYGAFWNADMVSAILNWINVLFLVVISIIPYIIVISMYRKESFIRRKRILFFGVFVYFLNDIWIVSLLMGSNLRYYFYTNCSLLCFPESLEIVTSNVFVTFASVFMMLFIPIIVNMFLPWTRLLKKHNLNMLYNMDENISMILHTYKNAFTSIYNYSDSSQPIPISDEKKLEIINKVSKTQIGNLGNVIDSLDELSVRFKKPDCANVIICLRNAIELAALPSDIKIIENYFSTPVFVHANANQLKECFLCIINNSKDALRDTAQPKISVMVISLDKSVYIEIRDNGCGMENTDIVFKPLYSTKMGGSNFGIGLTFTQKLIKSLNGHIDIKSKKNECTSVQIALPETEYKRPIHEEQSYEKN